MSIYEKKARNLRRMSIVFFVVAWLFALAGIALWIVTGLPTSAITIACAFVIATSGMSLSSTAREFDDMAQPRR